MGYFCCLVKLSTFNSNINVAIFLLSLWNYLNVGRWNFIKLVFEIRVLQLVTLDAMFGPKFIHIFFVSNHNYLING